MFRPPGECPVCGSEVLARARACAECGADDRSGWQEEGADEESFDYEAFLEEEFGEKRRMSPFWWWVAVVVLVVFVWMIFLR